MRILIVHQNKHESHLNCSCSADEQITTLDLCSSGESRVFGVKIYLIVVFHLWLTPEPSLVLSQSSIQNQSKVPRRTFSGMPRGLTEEELDKQFELFLQEPVSDESVDWSSTTRPRSSGAPKTAKRPAEEPWSNEGGGSHEDPPRDSSGPADVPGLDTLEEDEEKSRFFTRLQAEVSSPLDFSKLMGALDSTGSTAGETHGMFVEAAEPGAADGGARGRRSQSPAAAAAPQYSQEFEEEEQKEEFEEEEQKEEFEEEEQKEEFEEEEQKEGGLRPACPEDRSPYAGPPSATGTGDNLQEDTLEQLAGSPPVLGGTFNLEAGSPLPGPRNPLTRGDASSSAEPPVHQQPWSLRQEVDRLMCGHSTGPAPLGPLHPRAERPPGGSSTPPPTKRGRRAEAGAPRRQKKTSKHQEDEGWGGGTRAAWSRSGFGTRGGSCRSSRAPDQDCGAPHKAAEATLKPGEQEQRSCPQVEELRLLLPPEDSRRREEGGDEQQSREEAQQKVGPAGLSNAAAEEKLKQLKKEIEEQEGLLRGYQQENEKLYYQLKAERAKSKAQRDAMFQGDARAQRDAMFQGDARAQRDAMFQDQQRSREQLIPASTCAGVSCSGGGAEGTSVHTAERTWALLADISRLQQRERQLREDVDKLEQDKQDRQDKKDKKDKQAVLAKATGSRGGPRLGATDAARLKAASADIQQLKAQVEQMKLAICRRSSEEQQRSRGGGAQGGGAQAQRVQQLERQVRELELLLRSRKAPAGPAPSPALSPASASRINQLLELKVQRLEEELEKHHREAKGSFQAMEQHFHTLQARYEQHICELQQQLEAAGAAATLHPAGAQLQGLEATQQEPEEALQDQIQALQQQLPHKTRSGPGASRVRIERLNRELSAKTRTIQELSAKTRTIQELSGSVEQPQDRRRCPSSSNHRTKTRPSATPPGAAWPPGVATPPAVTAPPRAATPPSCSPAAGESFPAVFTGSHVSDVLQESEALEHRLELVELHAEQQKEALEVEVAEAREQLLRMQQEASTALLRASSQVEELTSKLQTQQATVEVLQEQLQVSRRREEALQQQLSRLLQELKEARDAQSPEVKLLCSLERKLLNMEARLQSREQELQQLIGRPWQRSDESSEVERWRRVAEDKSRQLEAFRQELDSILDMLRCLQRQGVVVPVPAASSGPHLQRQGVAVPVPAASSGPHLPAAFLKEL